MEGDFPIYTVIIKPDTESPGWWNAQVPALPGCVSCGKNYDEAMVMIREAMEGFIQAMPDHGDTLPPDVTSACALAGGEQ